MKSSQYPQITDELLSAYIDNAVTEDERQQIESALDSDPEIAWRLESLQHTVQLLNEMPALELPRSFLLPVADTETASVALLEAQGVPAAAQPPAAARSPRTGASFWQRFWHSGTPWLRNAAAASFVLFLVLLGGDWLLGELNQINTGVPQPARIVQATVQSVATSQQNASQIVGTTSESTARQEMSGAESSTGAAAAEVASDAAAVEGEADGEEEPEAEPPVSTATAPPTAAPPAALKSTAASPTAPPPPLVAAVEEAAPQSEAVIESPAAAEMSTARPEAANPAVAAPAQQMPVESSPESDSAALLPQGRDGSGGPPLAGIVSTFAVEGNGSIPPFGSIPPEGILPPVTRASGATAIRGSDVTASTADEANVEIRAAPNKATQPAAAESLMSTAASAEDASVATATPPPAATLARPLSPLATPSVTATRPVTPTMEQYDEPEAAADAEQGPERSTGTNTTVAITSTVAPALTEERQAVLSNSPAASTDSMGNRPVDTRASVTFGLRIVQIIAGLSVLLFGLLWWRSHP